MISRSTPSEGCPVGISAESQGVESRWNGAKRLLLFFRGSNEGNPASALFLSALHDSSARASLELGPHTLAPAVSWHLLSLCERAPCAAAVLDERGIRARRRIQFFYVHRQHE